MQFSSHESVSLEKQPDFCGNPTETPQENLEKSYEIPRCVEWVQVNGYKKVCLQFPDHLLADSTVVALVLQEKLGQVVYVLGDTAYGSCCIDYVAAAHINSDAIIHFGPVCFSKNSGKIPHLYIYEKAEIDLDSLEESYRELCRTHTDSQVIVIVDTEYLHSFQEIRDRIQEENILRIDGESLDIPEDSVVLFVGSHQRKLVNFSIAKVKALYNFHNKTLTNFTLDTRILKRRHFLAEKIKDSQTIGIVVAAVAIRNYLSVIERLKKLAILHGKKYYVISVGKPTVAKLANFQEIDVYAIITCALNEIYDSREFYKPIVTPYDIEQALNPAFIPITFSYDFNSFIENLPELPSKLDLDSSDVSLLSGKIRTNCGDVMEGASDAVMVRPEGALVGVSEVGLGARSWMGLQQNLGVGEVVMAEEGRRGIAQGYENENSL